MTSAQEAANITILILRTIVGIEDPDEPVIVLENGSTSERIAGRMAPVRLAEAPAPLALEGYRAGGGLGIRLAPPPQHLLWLLEAQKSKLAGDSEYFGAVPKSCLGADSRIEIIGVGRITVAAASYVHLLTNYVISPEYSLAGDIPDAGSSKGDRCCWTVRVGGAGRSIG